MYCDCRPTGAEKSTFAREFLPREGGVIHVVNADLIASGLSPLKPELAARQGGRLLLTELNRLANVRADLAFETTLSGRTYLKLRFLPSIALALQRIAVRVHQGGHDVPRADVVRRFRRSLKNLQMLCQNLADKWYLYDNSAPVPRLQEGP